MPFVNIRMSAASLRTAQLANHLNSQIEDVGFHDYALGRYDGIAACLLPAEQSGAAAAFAAIAAQVPVV
jgi:hypothetical protein